MKGLPSGPSPGVRLALAVYATTAMAPAIPATVMGHVGSGQADLQAWVELATTDGSYVDDEISNGNGVYAFTGVPAGTYRVCVDARLYGFIPQCFDHVDLASPGATPGSTPLTVTDGAHITGVDFDLAEGGGLAGRITDARTGVPIEGLSAILTYFDGQGAYYGEGHPAATDSDGRWHIRGLPDGDYYIAFDAYGPFSDAGQIFGGECGSTCDPATGTRVTIADGSVADGIDFALHPVAIIHGRVRASATQAGVSGARVSSYFPKPTPLGTVWERAWTTSADVDGTYELYSTASGRVAVESMGALIAVVYPDVPCEHPYVDDCVPDGQSVTVPVQQPLEGIDVWLPHGIGLSGQVVSTATGLPVPNVHVTITDETGLFTPNITTGADGRFIVPAWQPRASETYYARAALGAWPYSCMVYLGRPCPAWPDPIDSVNPTPIHLTTGMNTLDIPLFDRDGVFHDTFDR
jgi:hypothetical protein